jgi:hypothetical protein
MRLVRRLLGIVVFVAILVLGWRFAADHSGLVIIKAPGLGGADISLWLALLLAFALGAILASAVAAYQVARLGLLARHYRKTIRGLESEVHQLRNLPLGDDGPVPEEPVSELDGSPASRRALGRGA